MHLVIGGDLAGGQLVAETLARGSAERGHDVRFVSPMQGPVVDRLRTAGFPVDLIDVGRLYRLEGALRLRRFVRDVHADLVHTHVMVAANAIARTTSRSVGVPVISHLHGHNVFRANPLAAAAYRALDTATSRLCARLIAVSDDTRRRLIEQGIPARLVTTVHNGFDPPEPPPQSSLEQLELGGRRVLCCIGRIEPMKGQADLVRALPLLPQDVVVLLAGRDVGGHTREVVRLADRLGVGERVVLLGARDDVPGLLAGCHALVQASWTEGFPIAPMEAMALRKPVVATNVGGTGELIGDAGVLVPARSPHALAAALNNLLADEPRRHQLAQKGYRRLRDHFSSKRMIDGVHRVYEESL